MMVWAAVAAAMCVCGVPGALALDGMRPPPVRLWPAVLLPCAVRSEILGPCP